MLQFSHRQVGRFLYQSNGRKLHNNAIRLAEELVKVPAMGDSISEGTVVELAKQQGDLVQIDDVIVVLETDKVSVDVRSPFAGKVIEHKASIDDNVEVGTHLFTIDTDFASDAPSSSVSEKPTAVVPEAKKTSQNSSTRSSRTPLIKFLGKRSLLNYPAPSATVSIEQPQSSSNRSAVAFSDIPPIFGTIPLSASEINAINQGFAEI